ncbi:MAG: hypothetical protein R2857_12310 [Vampirovibrionales bacterium]
MFPTNLLSGLTPSTTNPFVLPSPAASAGIATAQPIFLSPWVFNGMANPLAAAQPQFTSLSSLSALGGTGVASTQQVSPSSQPAMTSSEQMMVTMMVMMMGMVMGALGDNASADVLKPMQAIMALLGGGSLIDTATTTTAATELAGKSEAELTQLGDSLDSQIEALDKQIETAGGRPYFGNPNAGLDKADVTSVLKLDLQQKQLAYKRQLVGNQLKRLSFGNHPQADEIDALLDKSDALAKQRLALAQKSAQTFLKSLDYEEASPEALAAQAAVAKLATQDQGLKNELGKLNSTFIGIKFADHPQADEIVTSRKRTDALGDKRLEIAKQSVSLLEQGSKLDPESSEARALQAQIADLQTTDKDLQWQAELEAINLKKLLYSDHPQAAQLNRYYDKIESIAPQRLQYAKLVNQFFQALSSWIRMIRRLPCCSR